MANYYAQNDYTDGDNYDEDEETKADTIAKYLADQGGSVGSGEETDVPTTNESVEAQEPANTPQAAPVPSVLPTVPPNDAAKEQAIRDHIQQQYAAANDGAGIAQAKERAQRSNNIANFADAFESLAKSNSMAHGGSGVDTGFYQGIKQQGQQGIQQAVNDRQAKVQEFIKQNEIHRQVAQDMLTRGSADDKHRAAVFAQNTQDGASQYSKNRVNEYRALYAGTPNITQIFPDGTSAVEADAIASHLEGKRKTDAVGKFHQDSIDNKNTAVTSNRAFKDKEALGKDLDADLASSRSTLGQVNSKVVLAKKILTYADTSYDDLQAAKNDPQKAVALKTKLDHLTPQQYGEVVNGLMTQLSPGVGSFGQLEHLRTETYDQRKADLEQYFTSKGVPANMGDLILNNLSTLKNEIDTGNKVLSEHEDRMRTKHSDAFSHPDTREAAEAMFQKFHHAPPEEQGAQQTAAVKPPPPNTVRMLGSDGKGYYIPKEKVDGAKLEGFTIPNLQAQGK